MGLGMQGSFGGPGILALGLQGCKGLIAILVVILHILQLVSLIISIFFISSTIITDTSAITIDMSTIITVILIRVFILIFSINMITIPA